MSAPDDLRRALAAVADTTRPDRDVADDLARARTAARSRRRRVRRSLAGMAGVAVLGAGVGVVAVHDARTAAPSSVAGVRLVARSLQAPPYTFGLTPAGWSVQAVGSTAVTIVPDDGSASTDPHDFRGKLVILFDDNPLSGRAIPYAGRTIWLTGDSGYRTLSVRTRGSEPAGVVRIQYPDGAGWDEPSMLAFLASVRVGPGAVQGKG
jgi:hypothetical protein